MPNVSTPLCSINPVARHNHHGEHIPVGQTVGQAIVRLDTTAACALRRAHATGKAFNVRPFLDRANAAVDAYLDGRSLVADVVRVLDAVCAELRTVGGAQ